NRRQTAVRRRPGGSWPSAWIRNRSPGAMSDPRWRRSAVHRRSRSSRMSATRWPPASPSPTVSSISPPSGPAGWWPWTPRPGSYCASSHCRPCGPDRPYRAVAFMSVRETSCYPTWFYSVPRSSRARSSPSACRVKMKSVARAGVRNRSPRPPNRALHLADHARRPRYRPDPSQVAAEEAGPPMKRPNRQATVRPTVAPAAEQAAAIAPAVLHAVLHERQRLATAMSRALPGRTIRGVRDRDLDAITRSLRALLRWWGWIEPLGLRRPEEQLRLASLLDSPEVNAFARVWAERLGRPVDRPVPVGDAPGWTARAEGLKRWLDGRPVNADPWRLFPAWLRDQLPV